MESSTFILSETNSAFALNVAVILAIAAVAYTDYLVDTHINLGYLYLLPLALSGLIHRLKVSMGLIAICTVLHDWFGPYEHGGWEILVRNILLIASFSTVVVGLNRLNKQRVRLSEIVKRQRDELKQEMEVAAAVQQRLLPQSVPALQGMDLAGSMYPARVVGGDYYDYFLQNDILVITTADVAGKGAAAALVMSAVAAAVHMTAASSPHKVCRQLNQVLLDVTEPWRFVSLAFAKLNFRDYRLDYANAGHLPVLLYRPSTNETLWLSANGLVLGIFQDAEFATESIHLKRGDVLVMYTDGCTEATNAAGMEFSQQKLAETVIAKRDSDARSILESVYQSVVEFHGSAVLEDDFTLVVLKVPKEDTSIASPTQPG